ncbi:TFIIA-alpha and beta-like factor [Lampris incognitus]|uniref:TFIIA-alpha and beta-like factor n=1 Tax=Lampris incognitus TaxID=2546036 RepID=UPI0024B51955|nr:TFIIA-alpha and beta-like factor [Lampris incognitus]
MVILQYVCQNLCSSFQLWESKLMQTKTMEDFKKNDFDYWSNFMMQLPANYCKTDQEPRSGIYSSQHTHCLPDKKSSESLATFTLPAGLTYPVQIPAGVTLQTSTGRLYKVNVPVMVTRAPADYQPPVNPTQKADPNELLPESQENCLRWQHHVPLSAGPQPQVSCSLQPEDTLEKSRAFPEPIDMNRASSSSTHLHVEAQNTLTPVPESQDREMADVPRKVVGGEKDEAVTARSLAPPKTDKQPEAFVKVNLDLSCNELSDIVQLDGPPGSSDIEEGAPPAERVDFLDIINAEALQEVEGSSDSVITSSSSDSDGVDEHTSAEDEDPLNSGDDVIEQDIPGLFDTDNVIVCQYEKIQRSKNRWKFLLKDGVMCFGGRDYVFSKVVGEAEW